MAVGKAEVLAWIDALQRAYAENRERLTELDGAIGDADHGTNMDRGFRAVKADLEALMEGGIHPARSFSSASGAEAPRGLKSAPHTEDIRVVLERVAAALIRHVGGAAGPLYGTFFLRAAAACAGKRELEAGDVAALFRAGVEGVRQRGKAAAGDKTMLDALLPAVEAMEKRLESGGGMPELLDDAVAAAEAGMLATVPMQARKGRASYLGPRSVDHQDPGATSSWLLMKAAAGALR